MIPIGLSMCCLAGSSYATQPVTNESSVVSLSGAVPGVQQETKVVTGVIKDKTGEPIIGANILEKGTTNGTTTDIDGKFSIKIPASATLEVSYIGFLTQQISPKGKSYFEIVLHEESQSLNELVVVGYGTYPEACELDRCCGTSDRRGV